MSKLADGFLEMLEVKNRPFPITATCLQQLVR